MRFAGLAFAPRFVVYTSTLVLTAALLLIVLAVPASAYVAGVPLVPRHSDFDVLNLRSD